MNVAEATRTNAPQFWHRVRCTGGSPRAQERVHSHVDHRAERLPVLTLMLLRHAKAVPHTHGDDFARDLQARGKADAARLGGDLVARDLRPDLALVSSSARTRQTFDIVQAELGRAVPARFERGLYNATAGELRGLLPSVEPAVRTLLIVGHNPGVADLALMLARDGDIVELMRMRNRFAPCGIALVVFDAADWAQAAARGGRLDLFLLPEDLEG